MYGDRWKCPKCAKEYVRPDKLLLHVKGCKVVPKETPTISFSDYTSESESDCDSDLDSDLLVST